VLLLAQRWRKISDNASRIDNASLFVMHEHASPAASD
jgi:hypothetical protein